MAIQPHLVEAEVKHQRAEGGLFSVEEQHSWTGSYEEAVQRQFKHLDDSCSFCLDQFRMDSKVVVLPCTHGFHEACFAQYDRQQCTFDKTPRDVYKVNYLGISLFFPKKSKELLQFMLNLPELKAMIDKFLHSSEYSALCASKEEQLKEKQLAPPLLELIQAFIYMYEGNFPEEKVDAFVAKWIKDFKEHPQLEEIIQILFKPSDPLSLKEKIPFDPLGIVRVFQLGTKIKEAALQEPKIQKIVEELNNKFFTEHFKKIRALATEEERFAYISRLDKVSLARLDQLTTGGGKTSLSIKASVQRIADSELSAFKKDLAIKVIGGIAGGTFALFGGSFLLTYSMRYLVQATSPGTAMLIWTALIIPASYALAKHFAREPDAI